MARFTIEMPAGLAGDGTGTGERTGANGAVHRDRRTNDGEADAATRGFVSWVECWADA